jgi:hypothetical protein
MKNTHNLSFKFPKFDGENGAAWMEDEVAALGQQVDVAAQSLAHAALDAIALMGFAQDLAGSEANPRRFWLARRG